VLTSRACRRRQIGAPVVARGRAHQHDHGHLASLRPRPAVAVDEREVGPVVGTSVHVLVLYYMYSCITVRVWLADGGDATAWPPPPLALTVEAGAPGLRLGSAQ
jgi:hypothetical protein